MERLIQKQMNTSSGNFASFSGRIASRIALQEIDRNHLQLQFMIKPSQEIFKFSQNLVVYYWHFKFKVISFSSLHTARKVYETVSCLLPSRSFPGPVSSFLSSRSFPGQSQLHVYCIVFERVNGWLVVWCLVWHVIVF